MAAASDGAAAASSLDALARVPRAFAFRCDVLPLWLHDGLLAVALPNVEDSDVLDGLRRATRLRIKPIQMPREQIRERLVAIYGGDGSTLTLSERRAADVPAVRSVDSMFVRAIAAHASDIHVEPGAAGGAIRLRVDGILVALETVPADRYNAFVSRIKLLAGMDIADKRQPQDGRLTVPFEQREIDARVASLPTIDGEKLVIRLLDRQAQSCDVAALGMPPEMLATYRRLLRSPWGFIVVTGPTGSGKTTTLYASLGDLDAALNNVCSVEDPVEMRVRGVTQVGVNPRAGVTFESALRGFMRQDPDVIMVGEMRDAQTAAVAQQRCSANDRTAHRTRCRSSVACGGSNGGPGAAARAPPVRKLPRSGADPNRDSDAHRDASSAVVDGRRLPCLRPDRIFGPDRRLRAARRR
jgi:hypothetical protein